MGRNSDFLILAQIVAFPSIREQLNRLLSRVEILLPTLFLGVSGLGTLWGRRWGS